MKRKEEYLRMQTLKKIESDNQRTQHLKAQKQQLQEEVRLVLCLGCTLCMHPVYNTHSYGCSSYVCGNPQRLKNTKSLLLAKHNLTHSMDQLRVTKKWGKLNQLA